MASSSGTTTTTTAEMQLQGDGDGGVMDQRKRRRMLSNRESARRSRQRKQQQLEELTGLATALKRENARIAAAISATAQHYLAVESENSVLRAQAAELGGRLQALNDILSCMSGGGSADSSGNPCSDLQDEELMMMAMMRPWSSVSQLQPIMATYGDMYQYC